MASRLPSPASLCSASSFRLVSASPIAVRGMIRGVTGDSGGPPRLVVSLASGRIASREPFGTPPAIALLPVLLSGTAPPPRLVRTSAVTAEASVLCGCNCRGQLDCQHPTQAVVLDDRSWC